MPSQSQVALCLAVAVLAIAGCGPFCSNSVIAELSSPDGMYVATAYTRHCGATTGYLTAVDVRQARDKFRGNPKDAVLILSGLKRVSVHWPETGVLLLKYDKDAEVFSHREKWLTVRVTMEPETLR